jgi:hypothetical protein
MTPLNALFYSATSAQRARRRVEQSLVYAARILAMTGQKAGLAAQLSAHSEGPKSYWTLRFRVGFDEVRSDDLIEVDADLNTLTGEGMAKSCDPLPPVLRGPVCRVGKPADQRLAVRSSRI